MIYEFTKSSYGDIAVHKHKCRGLKKAVGKTWTIEAFNVHDAIRECRQCSKYGFYIVSCAKRYHIKKKDNK